MPLHRLLRRFGRNAFRQRRSLGYGCCGCALNRIEMDRNERMMEERKGGTYRGGVGDHGLRGYRLLGVLRDDSQSL